jgi:uncharacterized oligopeptide transporter (OPT) family protein
LLLWIGKEVLKAEDQVLTGMMKKGAMETEMETGVLEIGIAAEVLVIGIMTTDLKEKCTKLCALNAAMNALFLLSRFRISLFIAGIVS